MLPPVRLRSLLFRRHHSGCVLSFRRRSPARFSRDGQCWL